MTTNWIPARVQRENLSLTDQVYFMLKGAIVSLDLTPGSDLVEADLSKSMGTSVTPIREALRRLESEGLVSTSFGRSPIVRGLSLKEIRDSYEVRALLETWAVREGFPNINQKEIKLLQEFMREAENALSRDDLVTFSLKNREFHFELCRHCGNDYVLQILDVIADQQHRVRIALSRQTNPLAQDLSKKAIEDHLEIIGAIEVGDLELTEKLILEDITALLKDIDKGNLKGLEPILDY